MFVTTAIDTGRKAAPEDLPRPDPKVGEKRTEAPDTWQRFVALAAAEKDGGKP